MVAVSQAWHAFPNTHTGSPFIYGGRLPALPAMSTTVSPVAMRATLSISPRTRITRRANPIVGPVLGQQNGHVLDVPMYGTPCTQYLQTDVLTDIACAWPALDLVERCGGPR